VTWEIVYTKRAQRDAKKLAAAGLKSQAEELLNIIRENPFQTPPRFEKLVGDLAGAYSRRINIQHRLVYEVLEKRQIIKIISMWTHYE
jgi:Txe/YoeB family toxin of toxin-antitoxin system